MKYLVTFFTTLLLTFIFAPVTFAHVVVKPAEVGVGAFQTFTIGVPNEQDNPTTGLRIVIPEGLEYVSPNVKPGWTIDTVTKGEGDKTRVTEIIWTDGSIPVGQRDEFLFSAKVPAKETTIAWKAYQTYENGDVVAWADKPKEASHAAGDDHLKGPYSQTNVVNDIKRDNDQQAKQEEAKKQNALTMQLSIAAITLAALAIALQFRKK